MARRRTFLLVLLAGTLVLAGWCLLCPSGPVCAGRSLDDWFDAYLAGRQHADGIFTSFSPTSTFPATPPTTLISSGGVLVVVGRPSWIRFTVQPSSTYPEILREARGVTEAQEAIIPMGSRAVPFLTRVLGARDTKLDTLYYRIHSKTPAALAQRLPEPFRKQARRTAAAELLVQLGEAARPAMPTAVRCLVDPQRSCGGAEIRLVRSLLRSEEELVPPLSEACRRGDFVVATRAIRALHLRNPVFAGMLGQAAAQTDHKERRLAIQLLEERGAWSAPALPQLMQALGDQSLEIRYLAARALGELGTNALPARVALQRTASDQDVLVRTASLRALHKIDPDHFGPPPKF